MRDEKNLPRRSTHGCQALGSHWRSLSPVAKGRVLAAIGGLVFAIVVSVAIAARLALREDTEQRTWRTETSPAPPWGEGVETE